MLARVTVPAIRKSTPVLVELLRMWNVPSSAPAAVSVPWLPFRRKQSSKARVVPLVVLALHTCLAVILGRRYAESFVASKGDSSVRWMFQNSLFQRAAEQVFQSPVLRQAQSSESTSTDSQIFYANLRTKEGSLGVKAARRLLDDGEVPIRCMGANNTRTLVRIGILMPKLLRDVFNEPDGLQVGIVPEFEEVQTKTNVRFNYKLVGASSADEKEPKSFMVSGTTDASKLAGALKAQIDENIPVKLMTYATQAVYQAVKAIIMTQSMLKGTAREKNTLAFVPGLEVEYSKQWQKDVNMTVLKIISV